MAYDFRNARWFRVLRNALLALDSWIDSSLYEAGVESQEMWRDFSSFMERFNTRGGARLAVEIACEALTLAVIGGVVMAGLAQTAFRLTDSPNWLKKTDLAVTFENRYGKIVGRRGILHDDAVPLSQFPPYVIEAVISTEDRRFFDHWGIDPIGLLRAMTVNARDSGVVQGGSTLTQQLAKNLFLSNKRTLTRKINEAFLAFWLESHLTKKQILRLYLDRAYMGGGTFGIQAAAQYYFGHSIRDVSLSQAAMLAGLFKAPTRFSPNVNLPAARARAAVVLHNMVDAGYLTDNQIADALHNPASPVDRGTDSAGSPDWYLDWAFDEVKALADAGKLGKNRVLTVRTALDSSLQKQTAATIDNMLLESGQSFHVHEGAAIVMEPDGAVRAMVGGRDYGESQFNRAVDALRQPGSSFKPYVYLTALMSGFTPNTPILDGPICLGHWCPHNYSNRYHGRVPLWYALAHSLNTAAVRLSVEIGDGNAKAGRRAIIATARRLGVTAPLPDTQSLPLGADEVSLMDQATGYAAFANGGKRVKPYAALDIYNSRGDLIYSHARDGVKPVQVIDPVYIDLLVSMMKQVVAQGTGRRAQLKGVTVAGKTGTTNDFKDAWFCGYTGNYVGIVWYGNDDSTPTKHVTGGSLPAMTWHDIMQFAHSGIDLKPLPGDTLETMQAPVAEITSPEGVQTPRRREQLSKKSSEALGSIENLIRSVASPHARLDLPHRRFAQARRLSRLGVETDPLVDLR